MFRGGSDMCGGCSIDPSGQRVAEISYHSLEGAKFQAPSMGIKI
jgi:hypothetical protein